MGSKKNVAPASTPLFRSSGNVASLLVAATDMVNYSIETIWVGANTPDALANESGSRIGNADGGLMATGMFPSVVIGRAWNRWICRPQCRPPGRLRIRAGPRDPARFGQLLEPGRGSGQAGSAALAELTLLVFRRLRDHP